MLLPVGHYAPASSAAGFPFWITGTAVPSDMLLTKAWMAPLAALLGAVIFDHARLRRARPGWADLPMAAWCAWPLVQATLQGFGNDAVARPPGWWASLYLCGSWGLPWMLGRLYFAAQQGQRCLATAVTASALACLPFSLIEGALGPKLYDWVYEPHPLATDGADRYVGFRPLAFFEDGNQFGIWISLSALTAIWLAVATGGDRGAVWRRAAASVVIGMALAAQSLGALAMLVLGAAFLSVSRFLRPRAAAIALLACLVLGGAVYVSGVVPVMRIGRETAIGREIVDAFRSVGRGSFTWRISQDQKLLADARENLVVGSGAWDWWRGLSMLLLGQFGLVGLTLAMGSLLGPALRVAWQAPRASGWRPEALPLMLATVVVLAALDGLLNSFFFFPAIVAAGALARPARGETPVANERARVPHSA